ncbi:MAG: amidohydrolase family protein [Porticoccaceae bacterium]|nr:amidohydrolase family protein [Porticoccaceae bacterium]
MSVDVSPDGKNLVFDVLGDIYRMPSAGGEATLVLGGPAIQRRPRFSPDGSTILYISDVSGSDNLWVVNTDGSNRRQITQETIDLFITPAWESDGQYVLAGRRDMDGRSGLSIWMYHLDGGSGRMLAKAGKGSTSVSEPVMSPDGRFLYYTERVAAPTSLTNSTQPNYAIKRRQLSDGRVEEIVRGFGGAVTPQLSPDGNHLAFVRRVKEKTVLFHYDLTSGVQRPVYDQLAMAKTGSYYPQYNWFPYGRHVAIWANGKLNKVDMLQQSSVDIPFALTSQHKLTLPPRYENDLSPENFRVKSIRQVAVSPQGKDLIFHGVGYLWKKRLPDGKPTRLISGDAFQFEPAYSADGKRVAYVSWDDERGSALNIVTAKGRRVETVLRSDGVIRQPAFSADGKSLVYWIERGNKKMGGYRAKPGLYWVSLKTGESQYLRVKGRNPQFSNDGKRIYYGLFGKITIGASLESIQLDGLGKQEHANGPNVTEVALSPDGQWLAFKEFQQYYVMPYREIGASMVINSRQGSAPHAVLTTQGGYEIRWSADSQTLHWVLGDNFFSVAVADRFGKDPQTKTARTVVGLDLPVDKPTGLLALTGGRIITMTGEKVIEKGTVLVEGNRIIAVGSLDQLTIPAHAKVIDISGKTLMPGLVDTHGHLLLRDGLVPQKISTHYAALAFGITMNIDPSASELGSYASAEMNLAGMTVGPRLFTSGGFVFGQHSSGLADYTRINSLDDARNTVARKQAIGGVFIKSYLQPQRQQRQQLIKAAREIDMMVTPEGGGGFYQNISMILDGHVSIEHGIQLSDYYNDVIQLVSLSDTSLTPTLIISNKSAAESYFYQATRPWEDPKVRIYNQETWSNISNPLGKASWAPPYAGGMIGLYMADELRDANWGALSRSLNKLDAAGGIVTTGGHGQINGLDVHWEMWALAKGGMSNHRILRAATLNGAKTWGLDKQIGSIEVGKLADLIVLDANPLDDIRNTNTIVYTMINGRLYDSLSMNEIGNYDKPRSQFYWELPDYNGIDWNEAWAGPAKSSENSARYGMPD